jgi:hypothetical protein
MLLAVEAPELRLLADQLGLLLAQVDDHRRAGHVGERVERLAAVAQLTHEAQLRLLGRQIGPRGDDLGVQAGEFLVAQRDALGVQQAVLRPELRHGLLGPPHSSLSGPIRSSRKPDALPVAESLLVSWSETYVSAMRFATRADFAGSSDV